MNHALANRAPITVTLLGTQYALPRFRRRDWLAWGSQIDAERIKAATAGLSAAERGRVLLFAPPPIDHQGIIAHLLSPAGTEKVVRTCMERGGVPKETIERVLEEAAAKDLESLAVELASVIDPAEVATDDGEEGRAADEPSPLT